MKEQVIDILKAILETDEIDSDIDLIDELDSLELLKLIDEIHSVFGVEIGSEDMQEENFKSVDTIISMISKNI